MPREVVVRTVASGVCHSDLHYVDGVSNTVAPAILGHEAAGIVEEVGEQVTYLQPGDHVISCLSVFCGDMPPVPIGTSQPLHRSASPNRVGPAAPQLRRERRTDHPGLQPLQLC